MKLNSFARRKWQHTHPNGHKLTYEVTQTQFPSYGNCIFFPALTPISLVGRFADAGPADAVAVARAEETGGVAALALGVVAHLGRNFLNSFCNI
jgi:hypothetical protein